MERVCQSCGMRMPSDELLGTNADGSHNNDYCTYCFQHGEFTEDCTMDEMILHCVEFLDEFNKGLDKPITREEAIVLMKEAFPKFKRWNK